MMKFTQIAAITLPMLIGSHALATPQFFDWEVRATFDAVGSIGGVAIDNKEFVISGQTTSAISGNPWIDDPVTAPVDLSTLTLTFDGVDIGATPDTTNFFTYGLLGSDEQMKPAPIFSFNENGDFGADTPLDGIVFYMNFGGVDTWVGFGGQGGKRFGITTAVALEGVIDFGEDAILQSLNQNNNTRISTLVVPTPAAAWLLIGALGGLVSTRRRNG